MALVVLLLFLVGLSTTNVLGQYGGGGGGQYGSEIGGLSQQQQYPSGYSPYSLSRLNTLGSSSYGNGLGNAQTYISPYSSSSLYNNNNGLSGYSGLGSPSSLYANGLPPSPYGLLSPYASPYTGISTPYGSSLGGSSPYASPYSGFSSSPYVSPYSNALSSSSYANGLSPSSQVLCLPYCPNNYGGSSFSPYSGISPYSGVSPYSNGLNSYSTSPLLIGSAYPYGGGVSSPYSNGLNGFSENGYGSFLPGTRFGSTTVPRRATSTTNSINNESNKVEEDKSTIGHGSLAHVPYKAAAKKA